MRDSCRTCRFDPKQRAGPDACRYTTLYRDFLARNANTLAANHRMACPLAAMRKLSDLPASAAAPSRSCLCSTTANWDGEGCPLKLESSIETVGLAH